MSMTISGNVGLTPNGNQYKKAKAAQRIGAVIAALPSATGTIAGTAIMSQVNKKAAAGMFIFGTALTLLAGFIGKTVGSFFDSNTNNNRMAQADGEAALAEKNAKKYA